MPATPELRKLCAESVYDSDDESNPEYWDRQFQGDWDVYRAVAESLDDFANKKMTIGRRS